MGLSDDETKVPDGIGRFNDFRDVASSAEKSIYWSPSTGAREVAGAVLRGWAELGWGRSYIGYPTGPEGPMPDQPMYRQQPFSVSARRAHVHLLRWVV
jgi:uncharacterized protein with LGFP repeats